MGLFLSLVIILRFTLSKWKENGIVLSLVIVPHDGEEEVFDGNEGRSAGATMPEERAMPGGNVGDVLLVRGGGERAREGLGGQKLDFLSYLLLLPCVP